MQGAACVAECVLKTLACRGLRVGPSKGRIGGRGDREIVHVLNVYVPFLAPYCFSTRVQVPPPQKIHPKKFGGSFFTYTVGAFLLTVKLHCLQSLEVLLLDALSQCKQKKAPTVSKEAN